jgi:hypothetical protein
MPDLSQSLFQTIATRLSRRLGVCFTLRSGRLLSVVDFESSWLEWRLLRRLVLRLRSRITLLWVVSPWTLAGRTAVYTCWRNRPTGQEDDYR